MEQLGQFLGKERPDPGLVPEGSGRSGAAQELLETEIETHVARRGGKTMGRAAEQPIHAPGKPAEQRSGAVGEEGIVAREQLVPSVAGERDLHAAPGEPRQEQRGKEARIGERLVEGGDRLGQQVEACLPGQPLRGVPRAQTSRGEQCVRRLVEAFLGEADREGLQRILVARGKRGDGGRIDSARKEHADGDVGD